MKKFVTSVGRFTFKVGVPGAVCGSTLIYIKNKVTGVREPLSLKELKQAGDKEGVNRIVVVGGGLAGLATAYYLTRQDASNHVTLLEKERKCAMGSSSLNGGIFMVDDFEPWTEKVSMLSLLSGLNSMT